MPIQNFYFKTMNKRELKRIYRELSSLLEELESEIYSDTESYTSLDVSYDDVLTYYDTQPSGEEGL